MHDSHGKSDAPENTGPKGGYEIRDVHMSVIVIGGVALALICVFALVLAAAIIPVLRNVAPDPSVAKDGPVINYGRLLPPEPRLQPDPPTTLRGFKDAEQTFLDTYGWIIQSEGVVRLPIDRAMDIVAERGVPVWPPAE